MVENITAIKYLQSIRTLDIRLKTLETRISRYREDICTLKGTDYSADKVSGTPGSGMADKVARLADMIVDADKEWDKLIKKREEARLLIEKLENPKHQSILSRRYLYGEKWENICKALGCTWPNIFRTQRRALKSFDIILKKSKEGT